MALPLSNLGMEIQIQECPWKAAGMVITASPGLPGPVRLWVDASLKWLAFLGVGADPSMCSLWVSQGGQAAASRCGAE